MPLALAMTARLLIVGQEETPAIAGSGVVFGL